MRWWKSLKKPIQASCRDAAYIEAHETFPKKEDHTATAAKGPFCRLAGPAKFKDDVALTVCQEQFRVSPSSPHRPHLLVSLFALISRS